MRKAAAMLVLCALWSVAHAQTKSDKEVRTEFDQAKELLDNNNMVGALPMFEDLHKLRPDDPAYDEGLAMCLLGAMTGMEQEKALATQARAKSLLEEAQKHGDNSPLLITLLEKLGNGDEPTIATKPTTPAEIDFAKAENLFSSGDLHGALDFYKKALDEDPKMYAAALFAGDSLFKLGDCPQAGVYYAKAIAINPDEEQAYRYWGDCLLKQHDISRAEEMYIKAVIAQPYQKTTRQQLKAFAESNHMRVASPPITLPGRATPGKKPGDTAINFDPSLSTQDGALALMYSMNSALWQGDKFKKEYPNEKQYRHSLKEELEGIRGMLAVAKERKTPPDKLSTSNKLLMELDGKGMLECWLLLDDADDGLAQDYAAYRKDHRDLMAKYIAQYDVHPM